MACKGSPYSITERRVPELIPVLGSQHAGDVSHKPGGRLPLLSAMQLPPQPLRWLLPILLIGEQSVGVNSLPKTVTRQRRDCNLNPGPSAPESSTLTTRLPSHSLWPILCKCMAKRRSTSRLICNRRFNSRPFRCQITVTINYLIKYAMPI